MEQNLLGYEVSSTDTSNTLWALYSTFLNLSRGFCTCRGCFVTASSFFVEEIHTERLKHEPRKKDTSRFEFRN